MRGLVEDDAGQGRARVGRSCRTVDRVLGIRTVTLCAIEGQKGMYFLLGCPATKKSNDASLG